MAKSRDRLARIHALDLQHQSNQHKTALIYRDEESRRMNVHVLCLRDENWALQNSSFEQQSLFLEMSQEKQELLAKLDEALQHASQQAAKAEQQAAEMMKLQAELGSFHASTSSAEQLTREKQTLNRELERIRPELDRLQSQLNSHKSLISAKSELERQVNALEVELENEKRASQRTQQKQESRLEELRDKLRESEKALATERQRLRSNPSREPIKSPKRVVARVQKQPSPEPSHEGPSATPVQASLEENMSLAPVQYSPEPEQEEVADKDTTAKPLKKPTSFETTLASLTIQTPGNGSQALQRKAKGRAFALASAVEKSAFSITPFLNKTRAIGDESPDPTPQNAAKRIESCSDEDMPTPKLLKPGAQDQMRGQNKTSQASAKQPKSQAITKTTKRTKPLDDLGSSTMNLSVPATAAKRNKPAKHARKAASLDNDKDQEKENTPLSKKTTESLTDDKLAPSAPTGDNKRKKRKLLGAPKAILDEDDDNGEGIPHITAQPLGKRRIKAPLGGLTNAFGSVGSSFSPLKRDRRGVNASFLGA